ncbi:hypothetical protein CANARDRAFT_27709 [[Candida] arabinofermentans NRRL YB-2248]|uniref:C3H1-type domain-containing protein n=1 Tax=[Candida] arabinofermentans NRRL YB-2248 TaxID=983967 RepID=A0A1E4T427_9ASCO|nr:hypothetical protein CANARDRAFT_27709 [[Candida] arabinofermentans NRRL YB-2248]
MSESTESEILKAKIRQLENDLRNQKSAIVQQLEAKKESLKQQQQNLSQKLTNHGSRSLNRGPYSHTNTTGGKAYRGGFRGGRSTGVLSNKPYVVPITHTHTHTPTVVDTNPKFIGKKGGNVLVNEKIYDKEFPKKMKQLKEDNKSRKLLLQLIEKNRSKYYFAKRETCDGYSCALLNCKKKLVLLSIENSINQNLNLTNIENIPSVIHHEGLTYIKNIKGNYSIYNPPAEIANMQNSSEPCRLKMRLGKCTHHKCYFNHDDDKVPVALCHNILKNRPCVRANCTLSHKPEQYNAPSCIYYQLGNCTNDNCIFFHKLENPNELVCRSFATLGCCILGRKCSQRHVFECPDFQEYGYCVRPDVCTLKHITNDDKKKNGEKPTVVQHQVVRNVDNDNEEEDEEDDDSMVSYDVNHTGDKLDFSKLQKDILGNIDDDDDEDAIVNKNDDDDDCQMPHQIDDSTIDNNDDYVKV